MPVTTSSTCGSAPGPSTSTAQARTVTTSAGDVIAYDALVLATGSYPFVPPVPGHDSDGLLRLPHARRPRRHPRRAEAAIERAAPRARGQRLVIGGGLLGLEAANALRLLGPDAARRRVRAAADAAAARRRRRRGARAARSSDLGVQVHTGAGTQLDRGAGRRPPRASSCRDGTALLDRPGRLLGRHPPARRAGPRRRPRRRRARRRRHRRRVPHQRRERLRHRRVSRPSRAAATAWSRPATRWPRSSPTGCSAARRPSPAPTCPPSSSCSASTSPASATRWRATPGALEIVHHRRRRRAPTRSSSSATTRKHAARRHPRRRRLGVRRRCRPIRRPRALPGDPGALVVRRAGGASSGVDALPDDAVDLLVQQRHQGRDLRRPSPSGCLRPSPRSRTARRPAPAAAAACRWSSSCSSSSRRRACPRRCASTSRTAAPGAVRDRRRRRGIRTFAELLARYGTGTRLRDLQAGRRLDPRLDVQRAHPRRRAGRAAGHQRPLPRQHPARRHLLGRAARARRRDHARAADRDRRGRQGLRPLHQDHRRPAHRPVRRARRAAARDLAASWSTPASSRATPTARRCAP